MPVKAHGPLRRPLRAECLGVQTAPGNKISLSSLPRGIWRSWGRIAQSLHTELETLAKAKSRALNRT